VFVLLAHYRGCKDRDTCNVHISQMASPRTAATPSTFRYGKSEDGYQKSKVVAKDRYRRSESFHIVLSGYRAHCSGEESGTTAQEADLDATMLSPTALPLHHSRSVFLEVRHHMIAVTLQCAVRPSPNNTSTSTKCPYNPLRDPNPIHATTTPSRVKTCSIRKLPPTTMTVIHIGRYRTTNRLHPHLISKKNQPKLTHQVLFKFRPEVPQAHKDKFATQLKALKHLPSVKDHRLIVGSPSITNPAERSKGFHYALLSYHRDAEALAAYQASEEHHE
jgi:hypothetical protein